jgi:hypothetical protein
MLKKDKIRDLFFKFLEDNSQEQDLIAAIEKQRQSWLQHRQSENNDERWRQNAAFYAGNHYVRDTGRNSNTFLLAVLFRIRTMLRRVRRT